MKTNYIKFYIACSLIWLSGCQSDFDNITEKRFPLDERQSEVLSGLANIENAITTNWATNTNALANAVNAFIATPSNSGLTDMQAKWKAARDPWESNESFGFGPVGNDGIDGNTDDWPVDINSLKNILVSSQTLDAAFVTSMVTNTKGFHAIEYLIFGAEGTKTVNDFSSREKQLLRLLTADLKIQADLLKGQWNSTSGVNFYSDFKNAGKDGSTYPTASSALAEVLGSMIDIMTELPDSKIEIPLTAQNISYLESAFSDYSYYDYRNNIYGVYAAYVGKYGSVVAPKSISDLVNDANPLVNQKVLTQFKLVLALYNAIQPASMNQDIFTRQDQLRDLQSELRKLNQLLGVEVSAALGLE
jgi:putative iron-regulated protein